ncbi:ribosome maturation factor RimP [Levilactobacillus koreensis]|uniref:Ribosome maturation factor RimP n=1 Tax=Levilactobacillus koreensis TaxID=637971 RepID=A0AAC8ZHF9_9LACO|nr:ribosome maturation factor RimP [Levilactobacillus koreensis]AKP65639.1 ribosome maturation protein RimP [Levilactobacillus koreensis]
MSTVVETVTALAQPIVAQHQFELVDVEFVKEGKSWYLRLYIDKPGGINIEECAMVSDEVSEKMDSLDPDPIPQAYFLEVSSPGAERPLKKPEDFERAVGDYIHVSLYQKIGQSKVYEGTLLTLTDDSMDLKVNLKGRIKTLTIPREAIAQARLAIKF